jgi:hypothetical protein
MVKLFDIVLKKEGNVNKKISTAEKTIGRRSSYKTGHQDLTDQIRSKARELWENKGRIQGQDLEIWLEAERIIKASK